MADFQNNFMNALTGGYQFGQQIKQGRDQQKLNNFASQAYAAPPEQRDAIVGQAMGVDAQSGFALGKNLEWDEERRNKTMTNMAKMLMSAPPQARPALYRNHMVPTLQRIGMTDMPTDYTPETAPLIDGTAQKLVAAMGQGSGDDLKSLRVGANGNYWAIRGGQFVDTGTPAMPSNQILGVPNEAGGVDYFGVNKGNLNAAKVMTGGQPQQGVPQAAPPQPNMQMAPAPEISMQTLPGADVPPGDEVAMLAAAQNEGTQYIPQPNGGALPSAGGQYQAPQPSAGQQLSGAPKPAPLADGSDYQLVQDGSGNFVRVNRLTGQAFPTGIAGKDPNALSPEKAMKMKTNMRKEQQLLSSTEAGIDQTVRLVDDILAKRGDLGGVTGMGAMGSRIPGTDWADLAAKIDTLKGRSAFGALQQMRANSPTGGALGAVSERELYLLQNAETQLQNSQSPESLARALEDYKATLLSSKARMRQGLDEFYVDAQGSPPAQAQDDGVDDLLSKYGAR